MKQTKRLRDLHEEALQQFERIQSAVRDERLQCVADRRFYSIAGAQWEGPLSEQFENRPRLEINKIHLSVIRIFNEYRNNRITIKFIPKDGAKDDKLAESCASLYRADEQDSGAEEAYDNAFEEAVGGGFGAWRLRTEYEDDEDDENEYQRIRIEPIFDADSCVFFDLDAKRQDKKDARHCFVLTAITREEYERQFDDDPVTWPKAIHQHEFDWLTPDLVYIAEYYVIEEKPEVIDVYKDSNELKTELELPEGETPDQNLDFTKPMMVDSFLARKKTRYKKQCHKYILSGGGILEDCGVIAGRNIPIVPVFGKRWFIDGIERCMGHVRLAKDMQRLKNMQLSRLAEYAALSTISKPIFVPEQISGHQVMWTEDNVKNYPYLLVNPITDINGNTIANGPTAYTQPVQIPPAMAGLLQVTDIDIKELLGSQQQGEQINPNTGVSGKAIELIQTRLDMQSFIYVSNLAKAIKRSGEIWLSMASDILVDKGRKMKGITEQSQAIQVELQKPAIDKETGGLTYENDFSRAKFDVAVDVGPSSMSRKEAAVRSLIQMMQMTQDPEIMSVLSSSVMLNIEGEGLGDIREFFRRKLLTIGALKASPEEQQEVQQMQQSQKPDANSLYLQAAAEKAKADAQLSMARVEQVKAQADQAQATAVEKLSGIQVSQRQTVLNELKTSHDMGVSQQQMQMQGQQMQDDKAASMQEMMQSQKEGAIMPESASDLPSPSEVEAPEQQPSE